MSEEQPKRAFVIWNGQKISDPALLPPHLRPLLEDLDGDGIPDLAQQGPGRRPIIYRDKLYRNLDEVPPELRAEVEAAMAGADLAGKDGKVEATKVTIRRSPDSAQPSEIEVDGRAYPSIEQVPAEHREVVRQAMNAVPTSPAEITINGKSYGSIDEVPAAYRELVRRAMKRFPASDAPPPAESARPSRQGQTPLPDAFSLPPAQPQPARGSSVWWLLLAAAAVALVAYLILRR
jgi:hypothetical protein